VADSGPKRPDATASFQTRNGAWVLEHVVEDEQPAGRDVRCPRLVVGERDVVGVAAVDEAQAERRAPVARDGR
jgi:hypothetical protein